MTALPFDISTFHGAEGQTFRRNGPIEAIGTKDNPAKRLGRVEYAARIMVGFNLAGRPRWDIDDLVRLVQRVRESQVAAPDATIYVTKGLYRSKTSGQAEAENGGQVFILNFGKKEAFIRDMKALAQAICDEFGQEEVILELQRFGISERAWSVTPSLRRKESAS